MKAIDKKLKIGSFNEVENILDKPIISNLQKPKTPKISQQKKEDEEDNKRKKTKIIKPVSSENDSFYVQVIVPVLRVRSGPNVKYPKIRNFFKGMVLKVKKALKNSKEIWYEVQQPSYLRYPERIKNSWFIAGKYNEEILAKKVEEREGEITVFSNTKPGDKLIKIILSKQTLQAFEKNKLVLETLVSTGLNIKKYRTHTGKFRIFRKQLSAYMQGPLPGDNDFFDLPGIPFTMYFTNDGAAIHGTYWHHDFGHRHSHGCINLPIKKAEWLYWWANIGTPVIITK